MIQIITTEEAMQEIFKKVFENAMQDYQQKEVKPQPIIITGEELCIKLGVTIQTLIRWRQKGKVPFMQMGASIRYDLNTVITALEVGIKKRKVSNNA